MSRINRTQRARDLLMRLERGPSWNTVGPDGLSPEQAERVAAEFRRWARSWILDDLVELVPELKKAAQLRGKEATP